MRPKRRFQDAIDRELQRRPAQKLPNINDAPILQHLPTGDHDPPLHKDAPIAASASGDNDPQDLAAVDAPSENRPRALWKRISSQDRPVSRDHASTERTPLLSNNVYETPWHERRIYLYGQVLLIVLRSNYANVLLLLLPLAYAGRALHWPSEVVLILNGLSMLPLTLLVALGTEELGTNIGPTFAALMAYSFGNVGTIIISCILLRRGEILVVQTSLLGAIVFNLLVVVGCQYITTGIRREQSRFHETMASVNGSTLLLAMANIALPAVLRQVQDEGSVIKVSRGLAIMLIPLYAIMLFFRFWSHSRRLELAPWEDDEEEEEEPSILAAIPALALLIAATTALTANTEFFVDTLDDVTSHHDISRTFIGFIFLPLVSNALSHFTELGDAWRDKMDKAANVAFGCSVQIALFILPLSVLVGWALKQNMALNFDIFLNASAFIAVLLVNAVTQNGKSNYFEGCLLLNCYLGIAIGAFFYPAGVGDGKGRPG